MFMVIAENCIASIAPCKSCAAASWLQRDGLPRAISVLGDRLTRPQSAEGVCSCRPVRAPGSVSGSQLRGLVRPLGEAHVLGFHVEIKRVVAAVSSDTR